MTTTENLFHLQTPGAPVHAIAGPLSQAWCGVRPQFRHRRRTGTRDEVTCPRCLKALTRGRAMARGR